MNAFDNLAEFQLDVLKEVGNIGSGHAATALSKMLNKPVDMLIPKVNLLPFEQITESVGGSEQVVIAVYLRVIGDAPSDLFIIFSQESASRLLCSIMGVERRDDQPYSELERSALSEVGNILAGSYLSSLSDFTGLRLIPTVPGLAIDMAGAILSFGLIHFGHMGDQALLIETKFMEGKNEVEGYFFMIPDPDSFNRIFTALGVPLE